MLGDPNVRVADSKRDKEGKYHPQSPDSGSTALKLFAQGRTAPKWSSWMKIRQVGSQVVTSV